MASKSPDSSRRKREDGNKRWLSYLVSTGAVVTVGQADAAIMHFDPFPDLVASDTNIESSGGHQQININFNVTGKGGSLTFSSTASVGNVADPSSNQYQLSLRPADLLSTGFKSTNYRVDDGAAALGGENIRAALGLSAGDLIDSSLNWNAGAFDKNGVQSQNLASGGNQYLGVRFPPIGTSNYGWVNYSYAQQTGDTGLAEVTLHEYGLETDFGEGIRAGARPAQIPLPSTLALLVAGASGVWALRRRRNDRAKARQAA